ncbi:ABC transporter permease [Butyrivibrio sp. JL13D10]|uniref:ABC transporter permease n=1 Tax=Butyrivibrio sp. JL13D10 TaxID=3236815 RepID=UPI0038B66CC5
MRQFMALSKRNIHIYFRDFSTVFFSVLSTLIVIALMLFFLGDLNNEAILQVVKGTPGRDAARDNKLVSEIIFYWTVAGILAINAASVAHAFYANMIKDRGSNKLNSIMVMPIKRSIIVSSYVFCAWFISVIMGVFAFAITDVIAAIKGYAILSAADHLKVIALIFVNAFVYSAILLFLATVNKSENGWGAFGIVIGTVAGFFGGIYLAIGGLNDTIVKVIKCFPFIYATSAFRSVMLKDVEDVFFTGLPSEARSTTDLAMGTKLTLFENELSQPAEIGILVMVGLVFMVLCSVVLTYSKRKDR